MISSLKKIINVTGTVIHTNFGRSILSKEAIDSLEWACSSHISLEYDVESGERGHRDRVTEGLLRSLTGCEASAVVNNNAAAVLLCLNTLASGREVIVSRGELIEIGGSFRIPEVMRSSGAILQEVGTTNRTYIKDYRNAINENTALLLKVHPSNYQIEGFSNSPDITEIIALGRETGILVMEDLGSGALVDLTKYGLPKEPIVKDRISAGVDVVTFSGDKLLGGPQSGIIAGKQIVVDSVRSNPLMRCVRVGKMTIAALDATLRLYVDGMEKNIPSIAHLSRPLGEIQRIAEAVYTELVKLLGNIAIIAIEDGLSQVGSGSLPVENIPSKHIVLKPKKISVDKLAELFRHNEVPVIGRISEGRFIMDMRVIYEKDIEYIIEAARKVKDERERMKAEG